MGDKTMNLKNKVSIVLVISAIIGSVIADLFKTSEDLENICTVLMRRGNELFGGVL